MKSLLVVSAAFEVGIGIGLLALPSVVARMLLGATLDAPAARTVARVAGAALLALGVACWIAAFDTPSRAARGVVGAMALYNVGAVVVLGVAGVKSQRVGFGLWPAVVLHTVMTVWCVANLMGRPAVLPS
jgi:hypothetical protein